MRRGFVLGKFMPPHDGHLLLCRTGMAMVDALTVLVCSTDREHIAGMLRHRWMNEMLPGARVRHMHRDIPQTPEEHPDFWPVWRAAVKEFHPEPIDLVFGSEAYVHRLAAEVGAEAVIVDPQRLAVPISATIIRNDPAGSWPSLPAVVRPYFQKRLCILGPESSGKSTLAARLAEHFGSRFMPEYGRAYDAAHRNGRGWQDGDFRRLAETHIAMRGALAPLCGPLLIEDTDPFQTAVWAEHLLGSAPSELEELSRAAPADRYLVLSAEAPWVDDGTRYTPEAKTRQRFVDRLVNRLAGARIPFDLISGEDWEERYAKALGVAESLRRADALSGVSPKNACSA